MTSCQHNHAFILRDLFTSVHFTHCCKNWFSFELNLMWWENENHVSYDFILPKFYCVIVYVSLIVISLVKAFLILPTLCRGLKCATKNNICELYICEIYLHWKEWVFCDSDFTWFIALLGNFYSKSMKRVVSIKLKQTIGRMRVHLLLQNLHWMCAS